MVQIFPEPLAERNPQKRNPRSKRLRRQREILAAASREFRDRGFHATGMRDIANALGMTVGNLYYYFANKQELLAFCQRETLGGLLELAEWVRALGVRADAGLYLLVLGHVACLNEGIPGSLAHLEVEELGEAWRAEIVAARDDYERAIRRQVRFGCRAGVFRPAGEKVATLAILGAVNWTVKWFREDGPEDARSIGRAFAEQLVRGLLADGVELEIPEIDVPRFGPEVEEVS